MSRPVSHHGRKNGVIGKSPPSTAHPGRKLTKTRLYRKIDITAGLRVISPQYLSTIEARVGTTLLFSIIKCVGAHF